MFLRRIGGLAALGALALACTDRASRAVVDTAAPVLARGFANVAQPTLPAPIVSLSTLTLPSRDSVGVVVAWTRRCSGTVCPAQWLVTTMVSGAPVVIRTRSTLRDTLRLAKQPCPETRTASAAVNATVGSVTSPAGTARLWLACRPLAASEMAARDAAFRDTFPVTVVRSTNPHGRFAVIGQTIQLCALARNRYTGDVVVLMHPSLTAAQQDALELACEPLRVAYEAERAG